jgi:hypothetical protein
MNKGGHTCGAMVTDGVRSSSSVSRTRGWRPVRPVRRCLRLTSGAQLQFKFPMIFTHLNFEIQNGDLLDIKNSPNFAERHFEA